jgi:molecular chaperone GrpE
MSGEQERDPEIRVVDRRWWARAESPEPVSPGVTGDAGSSLKPTYVEELERRVSEMATELQTARAEYRRSLEEFEHVKARIRRDIGRDVERGRRAVIVDLLEVLDNLDRAIAAMPAAQGDATSDHETVGNLARGVELVRDQFLAKLGALGITRIAAAGMPFDAERHEAVTTTNVSDQAQEGTVVAVIREGYVVNDELLRPAAVVVGRRQST